MTYGSVKYCPYNNLINGVTSNSRQLGYFSLHPIITPRPIEKSMPITREMDYVVIASWAVWEYLSDAHIISILVNSINPQVAAKAIQDSLQACDYNGNSCVMVIRLLKPELSFSSTITDSEQSSSHILIPSMRIRRNKNEKSNQQKVQQNCRLESVGEVIREMEERPTVCEEKGYSSGREPHGRIAACDKVSRSEFTKSFILIVIRVRREKFELNSSFISSSYKNL
ncbi:hypothetical protein DICVIV_13039 [Dictyocaulus viviparus]|uniref:PPM-type phosphatase domain-containing protein n=1 Tax=Dictyocaulus viviparus TaxID=29172 RepID=A0A0D8XB47_DICVI|nr:hypothetical protein DICVIV_13039 [Dictyocaulus viviparus]